MDINLVLTTGYTYDPNEREHGGSVGFSIPLFSKTEKLKKRSDAIKFLASGAKLIRDLESSLSQRQIRIEQTKFLQAKFNNEGIDAANAYFDVLSKIAELDAKIIQYHRELQCLINPFLENPQILPVRNKYETPLVQP